MHLEHSVMFAYNPAAARVRGLHIAGAHSTVRRLLGLVLLACSWASACSEPATARPEHLVARPAFSADIAAGATLRCAPRPNVTSRSVEPGSDFDVNGNGIVCEERLGPAGLPGSDGAPPLLMDDAIVPVSED